jgi:hypothetical protein
MAVALVITWLGAYRFSPMHPLLAAPAWAFTYGFGAAVEVWPGVVRYLTVDDVMSLSVVANFIVWSLLSYLCLVVASRRRAQRSST